MKTFFIVTAITITTMATASAQTTTISQSSTAQASTGGGKFNFTEETHDYGSVPEGPLAECDFVFRNTGNEPITIYNAVGSCGCTVPEWPHQPIVPGATGIIHVKYSTSGHQGPISKDITIKSNAQDPVIMLHIKGNVIPKPNETANVEKSKKM